MRSLVTASLALLYASVAQAARFSYVGVLSGDKESPMVVTRARFRLGRLRPVYTRWTSTQLFR